MTRIETVVNVVALWIGYIAMAAGGAGLVLLLIWVVLQAAWRMWFHGWNVADIFDATEAWRRANPQRFDRWKKRNDLDD